jgi:hypothetical protein
MTYHYYTWNSDENIQWWNTDHWTSSLCAIIR